MTGLALKSVEPQLPVPPMLLRMAPLQASPAGTDGEVLSVGYSGAAKVTAICPLHTNALWGPNLPVTVLLAEEYWGYTHAHSRHDNLTYL